jgi:hypothetical protein
MKRGALLIANTSNLRGTKVDLHNFSLFLKSNFGGAWYDNEICKLYNPSRSDLLDTIQKMKSFRYDYVVVLFSGHGGQRHETVLELNKNEELIKESELKGIASRQLTIFDCCRVMMPRPSGALFESDSMQFSLLINKEPIRKKYDERIMQSIPQQATLYSCSVDQSSYDTSNGGAYLSNLLEAARNISDEKFMTIGAAHQLAYQPTYEYSLGKKEGPQNPDASLPKCLTEQQLIISMN